MWTFPPSKILVPVDFGEASGRAVSVAAALAARTGGRLHLLHVEVLEVPAYFTQDQVRALEHERQMGRARAREFLREFGVSHGASQFTSHIDEGLASSAIVDEAAAADLVVMGTHGRRGPARWWMGSVAERVVRQSATPVLVVRAGQENVPAAAVFARAVVVASATDDDAASRRAAAGLVGTFGGIVADPVAACDADLAREPGASLVVVPGAARRGVFHAHPGEHWLSHCALPMVFLPDPVSRSVRSESL
jgi:nucleotide-binding universal stress UspA family protein